MNELYLIDASVIIDAHEYYYPIDRVGQFWDWLAQHAIAGNIPLRQDSGSLLAAASASETSWESGDERRPDASTDRFSRYAHLPTRTSPPLPICTKASGYHAAHRWMSR